MPVSVASNNSDAWEVLTQESEVSQVSYLDKIRRKPEGSGCVGFGGLITTITSMEVLQENSELRLHTQRTLTHYFSSPTMGQLEQLVRQLDQICDTIPKRLNELISDNGAIIMEDAERLMDLICDQFFGDGNLLVKLEDQIQKNQESFNDMSNINGKQSSWKSVIQNVKKSVAWNHFAHRVLANCRKFVEIVVAADITMTLSIPMQKKTKKKNGSSSFKLKLSIVKTGSCVALVGFMISLYSSFGFSLSFIAVMSALLLMCLLVLRGQSFTTEKVQEGDPSEKVKTGVEKFIHHEKELNRMLEFCDYMSVGFNTAKQRLEALHQHELQFKNLKNQLKHLTTVSVDLRHMSNQSLVAFFKKHDLSHVAHKFSDKHISGKAFVDIMNEEDIRQVIGDTGRQSDDLDTRRLMGLQSDARAGTFAERGSLLPEQVKWIQAVFEALRRDAQAVKDNLSPVWHWAQAEPSSQH